MNCILTCRKTRTVCSFGVALWHAYLNVTLACPSSRYTGFPVSAVGKTKEPRAIQRIFFSTQKFDCIGDQTQPADRINNDLTNEEDMLTSKVQRVKAEYFGELYDKVVATKDHTLGANACCVITDRKSVCYSMNKRKDFYEEIKTSDDAGLPLVPRSLLDLEAENILLQGNEQGHSLWWKFKEMAAERPNFHCKDVIESWICEGNKSSRSAITYTILVLRSWKKHKRALQVLEWVTSKNHYELIDMDYAIHVDLIGKIYGVNPASRYYTQIPRHCQTTMVSSVLLATYLDYNMEREADKLISSARQMGLNQQVILYNQVLHFYKGKGKINVFADILKSMESHSVKPDLYTFNMILDLKARKGDVDGMRNAWKLLDNAEKVEPDCASYAILARGYIKAGFYGKAETAIRNLEYSSSRNKKVVYRWLLKLYAQLRMEDELERIWDMLKSSLEIIVDDYTIMIESYGKMGKVEKAERIFEEVTDHVGVKRLNQYTALLSAYLHNGRLEKAECLVKRMSKDSFNPVPSMYHQLIKMYVRVKDLEKAATIFREAQESGKTVSSRKPWYDTYLVMLEMFGDRGDVDNAEMIIKNLKDTGYPCGYKMYSALLKAYVKAKVTPDGFLDRMRSDGVIPNSRIREELWEISQTNDTIFKELFPYPDKFEKKAAIRNAYKR